MEGNESFVVNLSNVSGATVADAQATGTIGNDDTASLPLLSIADVSVSEGRRGNKNLAFTVRLSAPASGAVSYSIATGNLSASAGQDYLAQSLGGQMVPAGSTSKSFVVAIVGDTVKEPDETFSVTVSQVSGAATADGYAIGTIVNDDRR